MKVLTKEQIKEADYYTIQHEPITSTDLMERAAAQFVKEYCWLYPIEKKVHIVCGLGNNGGDGLAIARLLYQKGYEVNVSIIRYANNPTVDFEVNRQRLENLIVPINCYSNSDLEIQPNTVLIDALFGVGLTRPLANLAKNIVEKINASRCEIVAVDLPSGLFADSLNSEEDCICKATYTFTFEVPKQSFFYRQNENNIGQWKVIPIGLHPQFLLNVTTQRFYTTQNDILRVTQTPSSFSHKGSFGFGLLVAGSYGMMGAALLASKAALRSGIGKLSVAVPNFGHTILQIGVPEALCIERTSSLTLIDYTAIAIGPGLGTSEQTQVELTLILEEIKQLNKKLVIDADGLNCLSLNKKNLALLPQLTILTPHPKEFERLIGKKWKNETDQEELLLKFCKEYHVIVCLKGKYTRIVTPDGQIYYNSTGNAGMATAGSGDVLTGIILAFLAQGYSPLDAAILAVFEHGKAGDLAAFKRSKRSMIASDIIKELR